MSRAIILAAVLLAGCAFPTDLNSSTTKLAASVSELGQVSHVQSEIIKAQSAALVECDDTLKDMLKGGNHATNSAFLKHAPALDAALEHIGDVAKEMPQ